jgi:hypothetical protein
MTFLSAFSSSNFSTGNITSVTFSRAIPNVQYLQRVFFVFFIELPIEQHFCAVLGFTPESQSALRRRESEHWARQSAKR